MRQRSDKLWGVCGVCCCDCRWLKEALQHVVRDDVERLTHINADLKKALDGEAEADYEALIDELRVRAMTYLSSYHL